MRSICSKLIRASSGVCKCAVRGPAAISTETEQERIARQVNG